MTNPIRFGDMYKDAADALKPLPDGEYQASVSDAEATKSSNGKPMIKVKLAVKKLDGGVKIVTSQLVISEENPTAVAIFFKHLEAFGLTAAFWTNSTTLEQAAAQMRGKSVRVVLATREWQGAPRNEVANWLAPLGGVLGGPVAAPGVLGSGAVGTPLGGPQAGSTPLQGAGPQIGPGPVAPPAGVENIAVPAGPAPASGPVAF